MTRQKKEWVVEQDKFKILIGASSRDIRLQENFSLTHAMMF